MDKASSMYLYVKLNRDANCFLPVESKDYKFCFIWVVKYVGKKRGTIGSHWSAEYLLENLSGKNHENIVYQKLKHPDDVIFRVLAFGVRVFLHKVCFFVTQN